MPSTPTILVIVGITGDLSRRKLLPAVAALAQAGALPDRFRLVGTTRQDAVGTFQLLESSEDSEVLERYLDLITMDASSADGYQQLAEHLQDIERKFGAAAQRLFYLSVPPTATRGIVELLGMSGLAAVPNTKLLLEKPFGTDSASAEELMVHINAHFTPEQVYRIDHYLAKEMAQNIPIIRDGSALLRTTWNNQFIERIDIIAHETLTIEKRAQFYEQTGALRDLIQSHLLQLAAVTLMAPAAVAGPSMPERRLAALKDLYVPSDQPGQQVMRRAQYVGYRRTVNNPHSTTETYASLTLHSRDPRFIGVPITVTTGKALPEKRTEVRITYKKDDPHEAGELIFHMQPTEEVEFPVWSKHAGYRNDPEKTAFLVSPEKANMPKEAYEKVLIDAMVSDHTLFVSNEEVRECWRVIQPVLDAWRTSSSDLILYDQGNRPYFGP